jgi:periplasmic protein CpxP/Spy
MKNSKGFILAAAFGTALMIAPAGFAQATAAQSGQMASKAGREARVQQRHERLAQELGLNQDQKDKLKALHESTRTQMQALRNNDQLSREEKRDQMRQLKEQKRTQMNAILTPEQQKKFEQIREQHKGKHGKHRGYRGDQSGPGDAN